MSHWYMLAVVGKDRPGMVAKLTRTLFEHGCNLGEASMSRLGDSFAMMLMVESSHGAASLQGMLIPVSREMQVHCHVDRIDGKLHTHLEPNVRVSVFGADRAGIVAQVTGVLAEAGLHVCNLETSVAGTNAKPIYVMHIEGVARTGVEPLKVQGERLRRDGVDVAVEEIETLLG